MLINPADFKLPPLLTNVLNIMADYHLEEIYAIFYEHLKGHFTDPKYMKGSEMGNVLYKHNTVAQQSSQKWKDACKTLPDTN